MGQKIKILHIITRLDHGGSSTNTIETVSRLDKEKYSVDLVSGKTHDPSGQIKGTLEQKGINFRFFDELRREINPWFDILALFKIYAVIKKEDYDLIHTHSSKAGILGRWAAKLAGTRLIVHTPHGHVFHGYSGPVLTKIFIWLEQITAKITDKIITLTDKGRDEHLHYKIAPPSKFVTIHSGIELDQFKHPVDVQRVKAQLNIPEGVFLFGSVTRLDPVKGTDILIKAMAEMCERFPLARLMIVGEGHEETKLKEQCENLKISDKVIFTGYQKNVVDFIHMMDVFILPSFNEGMGRVIIEAMACGKPVIASRTGGIPALIEYEQEGILVSPGDATELAGAMADLISSLDKGSSIGQKGKAKVFDAANDNYSLASMLSRIEALYAGLIN